MTNSKSKRDDETVKEWIDRISIKDSSWLRKSKRRKRYRIYYDIVFYTKMKFNTLTSKIKKLC